MMWVKLTLPPRCRRRWPLSTLRLTSSSLAGITRTEVAVGTARLASIASTMRAAAPRCVDGPPLRRHGRAGRRLVLVGLHGLVLGEELAPGLAHRLGIVQVLPVDLVDQPDVGAELRAVEPSHQPCTALASPFKKPIG